MSANDTADSPIRRHLLFVQAGNSLRARLAAAMYAERVDLDARHASLDDDPSLDEELLAWADLVFVMEPSHRARMRDRFPSSFDGERIRCLEVPDSFPFTEEAFARLVKARVSRHLVELRMRATRGPEERVEPRAGDGTPYESPRARVADADGRTSPTRLEGVLGFAMIANSIVGIVVIGLTTMRSKPDWNLPEQQLVLLVALVLLVVLGVVAGILTFSRPRLGMALGLAFYGVQLFQYFTQATGWGLYVGLYFYVSYRTQDVIFALNVVALAFITAHLNVLLAPRARKRAAASSPSSQSAATDSGAVQPPASDT